MKRILIPTDFSETANNAFIYALHLAKSIDAEILVLNTFEMPVLSALNEGMPEKVDQAYEKIELENFENFKNKTPLLRSIATNEGLSDVSIKFIFEEGELVSIISKITKSENIDLIVMGTSGASGFEKKLFGTNTINTIKNINIPIFSIPHLAKFTPIKKIGFATLLKPDDYNVLKNLNAIAENLNAKIKCLHITNDTEDPEITITINDWKRNLNSDRIKFIVEAQDGISIEDQVAFFIQSYRVNFLAVVKRKQSFIDRLFLSPSLSQKLAKTLNTPLLILRE